LPPDSAFAQFLEHFIAPQSADHPEHKDPHADSLTGGVRGDDLVGAGTTGPRETTSPKLAAPADAPDVPPETRFAADNHEKIVSGVRGELLPNGGTMKLRLDPPELGTLQVSLHLRDGVVTAAFQTSNDDAARMLSHTLGDLRATLEAHGIAVDKLHVQQSPRDESGGDSAGGKDTGRSSQTFEQQQESRREQQRRDAVQRIWDKLAGIAPIDLVA
jgi:flagellar hook-length control protein FliK